MRLKQSIGRHYEPGQVQFITTHTYRRAKLFELDLFRWYFVQVLRKLRQKTGFLPIGRAGAFIMASAS
jgi:hypothetical protein